MVRSAICFFIGCCFLLSMPLHGQVARTDAELEVLQKEDRLGDWLGLRMTYASEKPKERLAFLLNTQKEAWRLPKTQAEQETWLNLLLNQGYYSLYVGDVVGSIDAYEKAFSFYEKHTFADFNISEYLFKPLGNNYTRLGDYESALFIQRKGLEYALLAKDSMQAASFYNNLAISYRWLGDLAEADAMCASGLSLHQKKDGLYALLKSTSADIQFELGHIEKAGDDIRKSLNILSSANRSANENYWLLSALTLSGDIALKQKSYGMAVSRFRAALELIRTAFNDGRRREKANLLNKTGDVFLARRQGKKAMEYFNRSIQTLIPQYDPTIHKMPRTDQLYPENRLFDALEGRSRSYAQLQQPQHALSDIRLALQVGDLSRNAIFSESDKIRYQKNYKRLTEEALQIAFQLRKRYPTQNYSKVMLQLVEQSKARALMDEIQKSMRQLMSSSGDSLFRKRAQLQRAIVHFDQELLAGNDDIRETRNRAAYDLKSIEKEIAAKFPAWKDRPVSADFDVDNLVKQIPPGTVALDYFLGDHSAYNIILRRGEIVDVLPMNDVSKWKNALSNFVNTYFRNSAGAMVNDPQSFYLESQKISKFLVPQWHLQHAKQLLILPDDLISYISFESLLGDADYTEDIRHWPFLLRQVPVAYAFSLDTWLLPVNQQDGQRFAGFFLTHSGDKQTEIAAVRLEEKYLSEVVAGSFFLNNGSTLNRFRNSLGATRVMHISTHSFPYGFDGTPALQMGDGNYFLFELSVDQKVPELVVLSACRTAEGQLATGEGALSLSRGFIAAGSNGTVSGLWNVNDEVAAEQMKIFYQYLLDEKDPAMALHHSKIDWLSREHSNPAFLLPYYWSGLVYTGKPQQIELQPARSTARIWFWSAIGLLVVSGLVFIHRRRKRFR